MILLFYYQKEAKILKKCQINISFLVEKNETLREALQRELNEELLINVDLQDIIEFPNNVLKTEKFVLTIYIVKNGKTN